MIQRSLVTIDPGFAIAGWARWREGAHPADAPSALKRLDRTGLITTSSEKRTPERLTDLHHAVQGVILEAKEALSLRRTEWPDVAIEVPSVPFAGRHRAQGVADLMMGVGVAIGAATLLVGVAHVILMPAPTGKWARKETKHAWLRAQFEAAELPWPTGIRGGKLEDVWDATWLGVQVLRTPPFEAQA